MSKSFQEAALEAEQSVASIKDPELKRIAFEKILDALLAEPTQRGNSKKRDSRVRDQSPTARGGPKAYVSELAEEGFFESPRTMSEVKEELGNRGHHIPLTSLSGPLQRLCQGKVLRRSKV